MKQGRRKPEILAPAGSIESLKGAIAAGADAVTPAVYSGRFMRPSILKESIPAATKSGMRSKVHKSLGLNAYKPLTVFLPSSSTS